MIMRNLHSFQKCEIWNRNQEKIIRHLPFYFFDNPSSLYNNRVLRYYMDFGIAFNKSFSACSLIRIIKLKFEFLFKLY
ncbi:hypothetical protein BpHYR1_007566 [Brachionus plicatilis]|uniref:Uncharacterized protein n=1 Tax=Brachionus plicatilis TaxID=10195 RepID=A0A3M7TA73_BRAPC|nr:hypothetical protein BpHYR1_007566 [Brachionus plicatilis]